jgi:hypothetical protein
MASARRLGAETYAALKASTASFVREAFGVQKLAAAATRVEQQAISDYCNKTAAESFMPIDVVVDLVQASGDTQLLRTVADLCGCLLVPLPEGRASDAIDEHTIRTAKDYADMVAAIMSAKRDGRITPAEKQQLLKDIRDLMIELAALAEAIKAAVHE